MKRLELPGIRETTRDYDGIEEQIIKIFRKEIYLPLLRELAAPKNLLKNSSPLDRLAEALQTGRLRYERGRFWGKLDSGLSKALSALGARWDNTAKSYALARAKLPQEIRTAISASESRLLRVMASIDKKLAAILPENLSEKVQIAKYFDRTLWRIDQDFQAQVKAITVTPKLTPEVRAAVAAGYTKDLQKYIKDFTEKEIGSLRKKVQESTLAGNRYETLVSTIQDSYGVSVRKAKFLARQETALMMASFKEARYKEAGVDLFRWQCVIGSPKHPVRDSHEACNGKLFTWDKTHEVDEHGRTVQGGATKPGTNLNPGEDYNCRCIARPIVKF